MKKIIFGITDLGIGGAERVLVDLANRLCDDYYITIFTLYPGGALEKELKSKINLISYYDKPYNEYSKLKKIKISLDVLRKVTPPEGYDKYIAFLEGPIARVFTRAKGKKVAWIHNDISKVYGNNFKAKTKLAIEQAIYEEYDKLVFVSNENLEDFKKTYDFKFEYEVIRNYLDYEKILEKSKEKADLPYNSKEINLLQVGRLVDQKAVDRFIEIHAELEKEGIHSKVYIIGEGPLHEELQKKIDDLGEHDNFYLLGIRENPYPYIKNADFFCLLSYYEGYGMVVDEAKILNKPIIITDTAAREAIEGYDRSLILNNNKKDIKKGLKELLTSDDIERIEKAELDNDELLLNTKMYYKNIIDKVEKILNY